MVIEGMGLGTGPVRPKSSEAPRRSDSQVDRTEPPAAVERAVDRIEISRRSVQDSVQVDAGAQRRAGDGALDDRRVAEIRDRVASGFYETDEVLKSILSGLETDEPSLFG